jgi:predicted nucleic acid-binding protein
MLRNIPNGAQCFVDANIFYYHFVDTPPFSDECSDFLERIERSDVAGFTSTVAIAEATHKVMIMEAATLHSLNRAGLVPHLKRHPDLLSTLTHHKLVAATARRIGLHIETITLDLLESAAEISSQLCLLTNDSITIAVMKRIGLTDIATNDDDFDRLADIRVWKPR